MRWKFSGPARAAKRTLSGLKKRVKESRVMPYGFGFGTKPLKYKLDNVSISIKQNSKRFGITQVLVCSYFYSIGQYIVQRLDKDITFKIIISFKI